MSLFSPIVIEILGVSTGAACVLLAVRENIWNWPIGILNNIVYFLVFWRSKLYADACLQIFYFLISIYGWWKWLHKDESRHELAVGRITRRWSYAIYAAVTALSACVLYFVLHRYSDSNVPLGDGITTALSLTAQYMLSRKLIENWVVWIVADVLYIGLYCYKSLYLTALLYAVFIVMCVMGYTRWKKSLGVTSPLAEATEA